MEMRLREEARRKEELAGELRREAAWVDDDAVVDAAPPWMWEGQAADVVRDVVAARLRAVADGVEDLRAVVWRLDREAADLVEQAQRLTIVHS
jgi:hypothetical protein